MISGLSEGLPFATKIFFTDFESKAFAPRPYTVSVGNATMFPDFMILEACRIFEICGFFELILRIFVCIFT